LKCGLDCSKKKFSPKILNRHDKFCQAVDDRYHEFNRLLTIIQQNKSNRSRLQLSLKDLTNFLQPAPKPGVVRNSSGRVKTQLPRHTVSSDYHRPSSPPYFEWPWRLAAAGDVISTILTDMQQINSVSGPPTNNDLAISQLSSGEAIPEIDFDPNDPNDSITSKAVELDRNPVRIFEYVRNQLAYEPYFGSVKGAIQTLQEQAGNDMDLASTLMALLRAGDIPCRYVFGTIELSTQEAASWVGLDDPGQAVELLQANGIPLEVDYAGGQAHTIRIDHVWVKAYIDNFPYRGALRENDYSGTDDGDAWIDLDASFKQHTFTGGRGIEEVAGIGIDPETLLTNAKKGATIDNEQEYVFGLNEDLIGEQLLLLAEPIRNYLAGQNLTTETVFRQRHVSEEQYGILPVTDQYEIVARGVNFQSIPDDLRYQLTIKLMNQDDTEVFTFTRSLPKLVDKKITLLYEPASDYDAEFIEDPNVTGIADFEDPNFVPAFMVELKSKLCVNNEVVAEAVDNTFENDGVMVRMGRTQNLYMTFTAPDGRSEIIHHPIVAGGVHALVLDPQRITGEHLQDHYTTMETASQKFDASQSLAPDETIGDILHGIGLSYFHQMDRFNQITAGSLGVAISRQPSLVRLAWDISTENTYGDPNLPFKAFTDRLRVNIGRDVHVPVAIEDQDSYHFAPENQFLFTSALTASALEHNALMQAFPGKEAASVTRVIKTANQETEPNVPIYTIATFEQAETLTAENGALANLPVDVKNDILDAANAKYEITIPKNSIQIDNIDDCNYVGYIVRDPNTGASDFVLFDVDSDEIASGEMKNDALIPSALLISSEPNSACYQTLEDMVGSTANWLKVAEDATTNAGLSYLPAIIDINHWFDNRNELDPTTTVASVLAVTNPITRLSVQSAILNVEADPGIDGGIGDYDWVCIDANEFVIHADVTRNATWQANIYKNGQNTSHKTEISGSEPNLVAVFAFGDAQNDDGYFHYLLTAGAGDSQAVPVEGSFYVDLTEPNAYISDANEYYQDALGIIVVQGTAWDDNFDYYEVLVNQNDTETSVLESDQPFYTQGILTRINTLAFDDTQDANIILRVTDLAGNVAESVFENVDISNPNSTFTGVTLSAKWQDNEIDYDTFVDGEIDISIVADDSNQIRKFEVWLDKNEESEELLFRVIDPNVSDPHDWDHDLYTYLYGHGPHTLTAYIWDRAYSYWNGEDNVMTRTADFYNNSYISNFNVSPEVATSSSDVFTITASLREPNSWILTFNGETSISDIDQPSDTNSVYAQISASGLQDGTYIANLDVGHDGVDANIPFTVIHHAPIAKIDNLVHVEVDIYDIDHDMADISNTTLPFVNDGLFELFGAAYHPDVTVEYRIDVNDVVANGSGFVKNITPGDLNEDGYRENSVSDGDSLGVLDFSSITNGIYELFLTVRCGSPGSYQYSVAQVKFVLDCPLKLGNVKFTQEDMAVSVAGIPLRITRTYDSLKKNGDGDFGHGWSYSFGNMDIELNETRSGQMRVGGAFDRDVTLTLPDGKRATFTSRFDGYIDNMNVRGSWNVVYDPPSGVNASLKIANRQGGTSYQTLVYSCAFGYCWNYDEPMPGSSVDPSVQDFPGWLLTTEDGAEYFIKRKYYGTTGVPNPIYGFDGWRYESYGKPYLSRITLPSGDEIRFDVNDDDGENPFIQGVDYYDSEGQLINNKSIDIIHDGSGHIVAVKGPSEMNAADPNTIMYKYDASDNLEWVYKLADKDALGDANMYEMTQYGYDGDGYSPSDHYITDVNDPRGLSVIKYYYDEDGRLIATEDARGNYIRLSHDVEGNAETVYDRYDRATTYHYNDRGNVTAVTNIMGYTTTYEYGDNRNPDSPTTVADPLGNTTTTRYDDKGRVAKVTDPEGNVTKYSYDDNGNLTDANQYITPDLDYPDTLTFISSTRNIYNKRYLGKSLLETTIDALGHRTENYYDSKNRLEKTVQQVTDPNTGELLDVETLYTYGDPNAPDEPNSITDPSGFTRYFAYDTNGNQVRSWYNWVDPNDATHTHTVATLTEYDAQGRATKTSRQIDTQDPNTLSETIYNKIGKPEVVINEHGVTTEYQYDELGNLVETITYASYADYLSYDHLTISRTLYDKEGRVIVTQDPNADNVASNGTHTIYDALGRAVETRRYENVSINLVDLEVNGQKVGRKIPDGYEPTNAWSHGNLLSKTRTAYDIVGRVSNTVVQDESGDEQTTSFEYDKAGKQTAVIDPLGHTTVYDPQGRPIAIPDSDLGHRTEYEYEGSRRVLMRDALDHETRYEYDALGRRVRTIYDDGNFVHVGYDELGRRTSQTDQAGRTRWFEYDTAGRLTAVILPAVPDPENSDTLTYPRYEYEYDIYGNLILSRDKVKQYKIRTETPDFNPGTDIDRSNAHETKFTYNELHKQTSRTLPLAEIEEKQYNNLGQLIKATDFEGQVIGFEYNDRGRLIFQKFYDNDSLYPSDPNLQFEIDYDNLGRKATVDVNDIDHDSLATYATQYDGEGRITQLHSPQGYVRYGYYDTGRKEYVYTPKIEDDQVVDSDIGYTYDELGRLYEVEVDRRNGTVPSSSEIATYFYNDVGSIDTIVYPADNYVTYTYDSLNRLTNVKHYDDYESQSPTQLAGYAYTLAADGMRTAVTETLDSNSTTIAWTYDGLNRLTEEDYDVVTGDGNDFIHTYVYDLIGNRLSKVSTDANDITYTYNNNDHLTLAEIADEPNISYAYDDNGATIQKAISDGGTTTNYTYDLRQHLAKFDNGTATIDYTYNDQGIRVEEYDGTNTTKYLIDPYNHTGYAQVFRKTASDANTVYIIGHDVLAQATGPDQTAPKYLLYDGHGSVRHLANNSGTITESYNYDAYGNAHGFNPASASTAMLYAGEMYDSTATQYYLRARWYSPATGRFNKMDPFAGNNLDPQSLHKYLYTHANPINGIDPSGEFSLAGTLSAISIGITVISLTAPALNYYVAGGLLGATMDTEGPSDAFVVALSLGSIIGGGKLGTGVGFEGSYELLYIKSQNKWYDYASFNAYFIPSFGLKGTALALEAGPVWNITHKRDYTGVYFSTSIGGNLDKWFGGRIGPGMIGSVFWSPAKGEVSRKRSVGFKVGLYWFSVNWTNPFYG